jgi:hypothetical protein
LGLLILHVTVIIEGDQPAHDQQYRHYCADEQIAVSLQKVFAGSQFVNQYVIFFYRLGNRRYCVLLSHLMSKKLIVKDLEPQR